MFNNVYYLDKKRRLKPDTQKLENSSAQMFNLDILLLESVSFNQFKRHLPQTYDYMRANDFHFFQDHGKVGDNSMINVLAMLAGKVVLREERGLADLVDRQHEYDPNDRNVTESGDFMRTVRPIFQDFAELGCATMWNDDVGVLSGGLFNIEGFPGFLKKPTDFFFR